MQALLMMSAGLSAGLAVSLCGRFVWASLARRHADLPWRHTSLVNELLFVGSHVLLGAGIGLIFWLSWGFTAWVALVWWQRGLLFGGVLAAVFGLAPLLLARSLLRLSASACWLWFAELTTLCITVGLHCSWQWQHAW